MLHLSFEASNISEVDAFLATHRVQELVSKSKSVLVQVFASELEGAFVEQLNASITKAVPHAVIIGTTTSGEIIKGKSVKNSTVLSFSFFEEAEVKAIVWIVQKVMNRKPEKSWQKKL